MIVREIIKDDYEDVLRLAKRFFRKASGIHGFEFIDEKFKNVFDIALNTKNIDAYVAVKDEKVIGVASVIFVESALSKQICCQELMWYIEPEHRGGRLGLELFKALEHSSRRADFFIMINTLETDTQSDRFYKRKGFNLMEQYYVRRT